MKTNFPYATKGQIVGLFGGSFDPAHEGHRHITLEAIKRLGLDQVWWLPTPGNPLKKNPPAPMLQRRLQAAKIMQHPKVRITDIETHLKTRLTHKTIKKLQHLYPHIQFIWIMGADNMVSFHKWEKWQDIFNALPVAVFVRSGLGEKAQYSKTARMFHQKRIKNPHLLRYQKAPSWAFITPPISNFSSSEIRRKGEW